LKDYLKLLLFNQNYNFIYFKNYTLRANIYNILNLIFKNEYLETKKKGKNIHSKILSLREFIYKLISLIYLVPGIVLYFFNLRFVCVNPYSLGTYSEELEAILIDNIKNKKKLILLEPKSFSANQFFVDIFFKNYFFKITSNIYCIFLIPFTYLNFLRVDAYDKINKIYFQRQYYYADNKIKNEIKFDHNILFEKRSSSEINNFFEFEKLKDLHKNALDQINLKKICFLHIRNEQKLRLRNSEFKNYLETIGYLINQGFNVVFFSKFNPNLNLKGFHFFDLNKNHNKKKQIYYLIKSEIYLGQISGPFFLANFLKKKMIITDLVIFNHLLYSENFVVVTKKYSKNDKQLSLKNIFDEKVECVWESEILELKNINFMNNSSDEILEATKEMIDGKITQNKNKVLEYLSNNKINIQHSNFSILRNLSSYYINKNRFID
tara:strand:- start:2217 stop:3524 length:1308 start_codon:yes stop_codon:yes gene_type:complete